ncbi:MAG: oxidoreductase [Chloroflexi bacterium]|jgi:CO/xanthine dehydrogenase Mo-binding subunit|nr:oxidoreductase [Chloroflexota bacterium]MDP6496888.1 xanthine dehydrogenase family protein molybdopterin-binding subunit [Dehalococcoidia bacterium]MQG10704.1 xanthine dehydrogenase family protein molybdopterin-binding subunit [SAR202 cluster bacterium]MQG54037.1 xanthine dehydrogenase family protein molybdopterin-binding subunit [SAR202 cluster bacterium]|tara:strand:- start:60884 stop:63208 length:2325 start_codon:yes stop_codon:yes gene_type:complete
MLEYKPNTVLSNEEFDAVGKSPIRHDGADKVTGRAKYGADTNMPGMLYGKILRSPHAHAVIKSVDTGAAEALPGVYSVVTSADWPETSMKLTDLAEGSIHNLGFLSMNILARGKALYKGHAVAAVAAVNPHVAEQAVALIKVDYEVLKPVLTAADAMKPDAPILHDRLAAVSSPALRPGGLLEDDAASMQTNISNKFEFSLGDLEQGFRDADIIVEKETTTQAVHQGYIEPQAGVAHWQADGKVTVWSSSQGQFTVRDQTARFLGIPVGQVKAVPMEIGGGFGAKGITYVEPVAALLSRKSGRPVKVQLTRTEVFEGTGPTSGTQIKVKVGATKDGKVIAAEAELVYEAGAFPGSPVGAAIQCMMGQYDIPNAHLTAIDVVINRPKAAAYRAPGAPAAAFAMETALDELAEKLEIDPLDFRLMNSGKEGSRRVTGPVNPLVGYIETLQAAKDHQHYNTKLDGKMRGRGVASGFWGNNSGPASALAVVNSDGTVNLTEGSPDIGGSRVAMAMHVAEVLNIPVEDIKPQVGDTDTIGFTSNTGGSSATFKSGWACYNAAQSVKEQMVLRAAKIWEIPEEDVEYKEAVLQHRSDPELKLTFKQIAARMIPTGGPIVGSAGVNPPGPGPSIGVHVVDVEVDPETGKVEILRYTAVQDAGKAIHPDYVEGQIQGGAVQGIGWALNEEYVYNDNGVMLNSSFLDYRMPTTLDLPMIDTVIVEVANPNHPYGVRGVGEVPIVPPMAAISNAIYDAIGIRMNDLPMSPDKILEALWAKEASN